MPPSPKFSTYILQEIPFPRRIILFEVINLQYLMIPVSIEKRQRLNHVCNKLGITIEQFFDTALREGEMEILSNEALSPGGGFWNEEGPTFKKDAE